MSLLISSGLIPFITGFYISRVYKNIQYNLIAFWLLIRITSDLCTTIFKDFIGIGIYPFFHVSVLLESLTIIIFYFSLKNDSDKGKRWIYGLPITAFLLEAIILDKINEVNHISIVCYNLLTSLLMLNLLFFNEKINQRILPIVKSLFMFHSVSLIYFLAEDKIRANEALMPLIYPVFLSIVIGFNIYLSYNLWSARKN